jgi:epoxyqueuosine reductase QueG
MIFILQDIKIQLIEYAHQIGIDQIGIASADPFHELKQRLIHYRDQGRASGFEEKDIQLFCDARHVSLCYSNYGKLIRCRTFCQDFSPIN